MGLRMRASSELESALDLGLRLAVADRDVALTAPGKSRKTRDVLSGGARPLSDPLEWMSRGCCTDEDVPAYLRGGAPSVIRISAQPSAVSAVLVVVRPRCAPVRRCSHLTLCRRRRMERGLCLWPRNVLGCRRTCPLTFPASPRAPCR